jgi:hypothetical protein
MPRRGQFSRAVDKAVYPDEVIQAHGAAHETRGGSQYSLFSRAGGRE